MNAQTITKAVVASAAIVSLAVIPSCAQLDPDYAAYKKQKQAQAAAAANPYGASTLGANNAFAVPGKLEVSTKNCAPSAVRAKRRQRRNL